MTKLTIVYGGLSKEALMEAFEAGEIHLNTYAVDILEDPLFSFPEVKKNVECWICSLSEIGLTEGGTWPEIVLAAFQRGFTLVALEVAPYVRFSMTLPTFDSIERNDGAPIGAITIASPRLRANTEVPAGFYISDIEGTKWLRGYVADDLHVWRHSDLFLWKLPKA
ncbi:helicase [Alkalicoccus luteus]|uniref:Helicase n=1 Tax=Alkalicoccus luteus TaxID=1237094 RepID=A0A969TUT6_9BACI|nr:helicase [Alkalicoccus luteus]NJP39053.1 helicase [Alkalicoccus luteus]